MAWRDTALNPRMGPIDARALFPIGLWAMHFALWTFVIALLGVAALWLAERWGYAPAAAARALRNRLAGVRRLPTDRGRFRSAYLARSRTRG
ncbi:MAG: IcmT/TraK family protein [Acidiferrobacterales bacterium]